MGKIRVLLVDDDREKLFFLETFIKYHGKDHEFIFTFAVNYEKAIGHTGEYYNIIISDVFFNRPPVLNDRDKFGFNFLDKYLENNKNSILFLYSAEPEIVNKFPANHFDCLSFEELQSKLADTLRNIEDDDRIVEEQNSKTDIGDKYSKEMCDMKHKIQDDSMKLVTKILVFFLFTSIGTLFSTVGILVVELAKK